MVITLQYTENEVLILGLLVPNEWVDEVGPVNGSEEGSEDRL